MATVQEHKHKQYKKHKIEPIPQEFIEDCKILEPDFEKNRPKVQKIYNKWIEKGKKPQTIGKWIRPILRRWYSYPGIQKMLPEEAHRKYHKTGRYSRNTSTSERSKLKQSFNLSTGSTLTKLGKFNQGADEYDIDELEQYDIEYLRIIIKWLHQLREDFIKEAFKWQTKFDDMQREKRLLLKTLEDHGIKI